MTCACTSHVTCTCTCACYMCMCMLHVHVHVTCTYMCMHIHAHAHVTCTCACACVYTCACTCMSCTCTCACCHVVHVCACAYVCACACVCAHRPHTGYIQATLGCTARPHTTPPRRHPVGLAANTHAACVTAALVSYLQLRSAYSHCQGPTGYGKHQKERSGTFHPISLVDWLRFFVNTTDAWTKLPNYCSNPVNYQTHMLAAPASGDYRADFAFPQGRFLVPAYVIDRVHSLVQTAFFVGITEYYCPITHPSPRDLSIYLLSMNLSIHLTPHLCHLSANQVLRGEPLSLSLVGHRPVAVLRLRSDWGHRDDAQGLRQRGWHEGDVGRGALAHCAGRAQRHTRTSNYTIVIGIR